MKKAILAISVFVALSGCETMPQQQPRPTSADDPSRACFLELMRDPRLQVLLPKVGTIDSPDGATIEMMASTARPTEEEKAALSVWGAGRKSCADMGRSFRAQYAPPGWAENYDRSQSASIQNIAALYGGSIGYGQFIIERQRIATAGRARSAEINRLDNQARQQEAQQDAARADAALQMMLMQQQRNQPVTTTCNRFMNQVNCTTR